MPTPDASLDLASLCEQAGVTPRTVRYYIQRGLLPSPGRQGPGTTYEQAHLERLQLIRKLQADHLPLAVIRKRLDAMEDAHSAEGADALDYIRGLTGEGKTGRPERPRAQSRPPASEPFPRERAQWERLTLADDIELHVRRPLSRQQNRRLERLLEAARRIFESE